MVDKFGRMFILFLGFWLMLCFVKAMMELAKPYVEPVSPEAKQILDFVTS